MRQLAIRDVMPDEAAAEAMEDLGVHTLHPWQASCLHATQLHRLPASVVISAPTSGGKSLLAEVAVLRAVLQDGKAAIVVQPFVALVRQQVARYRHLLGIQRPELRPRSRSDGLRVLHCAGRSGAPLRAPCVAVCTIEKACAAVTRLAAEGGLAQLGVLVVDELHYVGDPRRGHYLERLLVRSRHPSPVEGGGGGGMPLGRMVPLPRRRPADVPRPARRRFVATSPRHCARGRPVQRTRSQSASRWWA